MYSTTDFKKGLKVEIDGTPYVITDFLHVKPGKGGAFVRTKLKNLLSGRVIDQTFRSGEKIKKPDLMERQMQYLYRQDDNFYMMDNETFEQIFITAEQMGEAALFLSENLNVQVLFFNQQPVATELPTFVELTVAETEPGVRGDTATGGSKPATLETGAVIQVPLFINEGDRIKVDTRSGEYIERTK
jgi:elongation factor P